METRLLLEGESRNLRKESDTKLHQLLGRAFHYRKLFEDPKFSTMEQMAAEVGVSPPYFSRVLRVSFLAPDMVVAVSLNRHPLELTTNRFLRCPDLPPIWADQRELFGQL